MSEEDPKPTGDKADMIPKDRFDEAVGKERSAAQRAQAEAAAATARADAAEARLAAAAQTPKSEFPSDQELREAIENGQMTESHALTVQQDRIKAEIRAEVRDEVLGEVRESGVSQSVADEINEYLALVPEIVEKGSDADLSAGDEYKELLKRGLPQGNATKLAALRNLYGSVESLKRKALPSEAHPEIGDGPGGGAGAETEGVPPELRKNARFLKHYREKIQSGLYSGWDDPQLLKEMKHVKPERTVAA